MARSRNRYFSEIFGPRPIFGPPVSIPMRRLWSTLIRIRMSPRAGGTNTLGRYLYTNTAGKNVWEFGPLTRILTGSNPGETFHGYDILLGFDAVLSRTNIGLTRNRRS